MENSIEEDIKNIEEIIELSKEEIDAKAEDIIAILDIEDLISLEHILLDYKRVLKENEKLNSLIKKLEKDSKEQQWIQTVDDEYFASTDKAMYADELLSFLRGEE